MECFAVQSTCSVYFCHPLLYKKEGDPKLPCKVFSDEETALMLVSTVWGLFLTVSGDKYKLSQN